MKKLLAILVLGLFLIPPSQADDIRDFQIEEMSIGDSLLDYLSEKEIEKKINHNTSYWYPNKTFVSIGTMAESEKYKIYEVKNMERETQALLAAAGAEKDNSWSIFIISIIHISSTN